MILNSTILESTDHCKFINILKSLSLTSVAAIRRLEVTTSENFLYIK